MNSKCSIYPVCRFAFFQSFFSLVYLHNASLNASLLFLNSCKIHQQYNIPTAEFCWARLSNLTNLLNVSMNGFVESLFEQKTQPVFRNIYAGVYLFDPTTCVRSGVQIAATTNSPHQLC